MFTFVAYAADYTETAYDINMKMIWVEGGDFLMGCTSEQGSDCKDDEKNIRRVTVDGFYMGMFEVTMSQWKKVMGTDISEQRDIADPNWPVPEGEDTYVRWPLIGEQPDHPMYYVNWEDAMWFCRFLSKKAGKTYTLPTEAQWEYAARGGKKANDTKYSGSDVIDAVAWYEGNSNSDGEVHVCGSKRANALGIYDMSGNVREWCKDWYAKRYENYDANNPVGPVLGTDKVVRGGSWSAEASRCRVAHRGYFNPTDRSHAYGFRVVCIPE